MKISLSEAPGIILSTQILHTLRSLTKCLSRHKLLFPLTYGGRSPAYCSSVVLIRHLFRSTSTRKIIYVPPLSLHPLRQLSRMVPHTLNSLVLSASASFYSRDPVDRGVEHALAMLDTNLSPRSRVRRVVTPIGTRPLLLLECYSRHAEASPCLNDSFFSSHQELVDPKHQWSSKLWLGT